MKENKSFLSFLPKHAIGLDISDNSIEVLELEKRFGKLTILAYARKKLEPGLVENGKILNKEKLVDSIQDVFKLATPKPFKSKDVILSIPESKTFIHIFRLPAVISKDNIGESVQYEAEATIPITFDEAYHDYDIVAKDNKFQDVLYVASFKNIVDDYREVVERAGLNPVIFEAESMSLARALIHGEQKTGTLLVDIGARTTITTVYYNNSIQYSQNINVGSNTFLNQIADSMGINIKEAERIKKSIGIVKEKVKERVFANLEPITEQIIESVNKSISYYKRSGGQVGQIILCGGGSLMPGLKEYFKDKFDFDVIIGDPLVGLQNDGRLFKKNPLILFSTVIGLALRGVDEESVRVGSNLLAHEHEHKAFQIIKPKKNKSVQKEEKISKSSYDRSKFNFKPQNKRMYILLSVFIFLIIIFVVILFLSKGNENPLIQFKEYNYPSGPVEY